jgi:hypothetical protein
MKLRVFACVLLALCCATPAFADGVDDAKRAFASGVEHFQKHAYAEALLAFEGSYRLNPVAGVLFNIALTQNELGRRREAYATFERYLGTATPSPTQKIEADKQMSSLRARLALVELDVPANARVLLDGHPLAAPYNHLVLDPGEHKLDVSAEGREPSSRTITARGGMQLSISMTLAPLAPPSVVSAAPPPAVLAAPPAAAPVLAVAPPSFVHTRHGAATLGLGALSLASFVVMAGTGGEALSIHHTYDAGCNAGRCQPTTYAEGHRLAVASDVFLGVGLTTAVASVIVAFAHPRARAYAAQPRLAVGMHGVGWTF